MRSAFPRRESLGQQLQAGGTIRHVPRVASCGPQETGRLHTTGAQAAVRSGESWGEGLQAAWGPAYCALSGDVDAGRLQFLTSTQGPSLPAAAQTAARAAPARTVKTLWPWYVSGRRVAQRHAATCGRKKQIGSAQLWRAPGSYDCGCDQRRVCSFQALEGSSFSTMSSAEAKMRRQGGLLAARDVIGLRCKDFLLGTRVTERCLAQSVGFHCSAHGDSAEHAQGAPAGDLLSLSLSPQRAQFARRKAEQKQRPGPQRPERVSDGSALCAARQTHAPQRRRRKRTLSIAPPAHPQVNCRIGQCAGSCVIMALAQARQAPRAA